MSLRGFASEAPAEEDDGKPPTVVCIDLFPVSAPPPEDATATKMEWAMNSHIPAG